MDRNPTFTVYDAQDSAVVLGAGLTLDEATSIIPDGQNCFERWIIVADSDFARVLRGDEVTTRRYSDGVTRVVETHAVNHTLSPRERDTILAALRFWQANDGMAHSDFTDLAENGRKGDDAALSLDEIDGLCERLNT